MSMKTVKCTACKAWMPSAKMFIHVQYQCEKRPGAKALVKKRG